MIKDMYNQFVADHKMTQEEKTDLWRKTKSEPYPTIPYDPNLPDCIVCDIDGTIARHTTRSPFDYTRVYEDEPIPHIIRIINILLDYVRIVNNENLYGNGNSIYFIMVSGREGTKQCRQDTTKWVACKSVLLCSYDKLFMRPEGDFRKDVIIKKEIFDNHVRGQYNVIAWFDDRQQVVDGIRELGVPVLQVDKGDF